MTQTIKSQKWARAYCRRLLCETLDGGHPHNLAQGVDPTTFSIANPIEEQFAEHSRDDLIREILLLRKLV